ncbi:methionyl-tRNA formyltransferase [Candidatus Protochlamydia phocaeensis]|uniref:methionyl-tRNA formyltransferase n=1 Tax=Candidatus Protochlamydia phocaeensis TaxID=1414722 RepID=UPI000838C198|nr:methionyl-tRNA formyltransferase [Candidatus Protochlamydia phocaeensis]
MKVIFFGTPPFAAQVLDFLLQQGIEIVAVVSKPDRPKGRSGSPVPTPVKLVAQAHHPSLPIYQPELVSAPDFADVLKPYQADLFVVVAYGEIIKQHLLDMPRLACINLHASLLPKYRGAAPIQRAIMEGETVSGATIMHMVKKMDAGDMIAKVDVPIDPDMTYGELESQLCEAGKHALLTVIREFECGQPSRTPQDPSQVTFAPKIELEDCEIRWEQPAQRLHNLVRGVNPHPGAWCYVEIRGEKKRLKINRTKIVAFSGQEKPGSILNLNQTKSNLLVATGDQALELLEVQLEGKKVMTSEELTRGIPRQCLVFTS